MSPPRSVSSVIYGVISGIPPGIDEDELRASFKTVGITDFTRLSRRAPDGTRIPTWSFRLGFTTSIPDFIVIDFVRYQVRQYNFRPLQCFKCFRYGHGSLHCRSSARCGRCGGQDHISNTCTSSCQRCPLCNGPHPAWSSDCPHFARGVEIDRLRKTGLSTAEAVAKLATTTASVTSSAQGSRKTHTPDLTYAEAVKASPLLPPPSTTSTSPIHTPASSRRPPSRDVACNTVTLSSTDVGTNCDSTLNLPSASTIEKTTQTDLDTCLFSLPIYAEHINPDENDEEKDVFAFTRASLLEFITLALDTLQERRNKEIHTNSTELVKITLENFFQSEDEDEASDDEA